MIKAMYAKNLERLWRANAPIIFEGKEYRVDKLSAGQYLLEPTPIDRKRMSFMPGTIFFIPAPDDDKLYIIDDKVTPRKYSKMNMLFPPFEGGFEALLTKIANTPYRSKFNKR